MFRVRRCEGTGDVWGLIGKIFFGWANSRSNEVVEVINLFKNKVKVNGNEVWVREIFEELVIDLYTHYAVVVWRFCIKQGGIFINAKSVCLSC